jgi:hypothetical protein
MLTRCAKCLLPETYPGISFNEEGICNYCLTFRRSRRRGEVELKGFIEPYQNSGREYDCIIALSGGRDSTFTAHYAVRELGLKVLAYTWDNGFMPEQTRENIKNVIEVLGIDHVVEKRDYMRKNVKRLMSAWIRKPSPAMVGLLCTGCRTGYIGGLVKTVQSRQIPLVIHGGGEPERSFAQRLLSPTHSRRKKLPLILGFSMEMLRNPSYLSPSCVIGFAREFFYRFLHKDGGNLRMVSLFQFIEWNEKDIISLIQNRLKWEKPSYSKSSWRADCKINELKNYLYGEALGFTKHDELLSGMIRRGIMARGDALKRLESDNTVSQQFLIEFLDELELNFNDLDTALQKYKRTKNIRRTLNET